MLLLAIGCLASCSSPQPEISTQPTAVPPAPVVTSEHSTFSQTGRASWYGTQHQGQLTASGERFDMNQMTAAHRALPFGTMVRVTNARTGKTVKVRINDRGPFVGGRVLDLSAAAAKALGIAADGTARVRIEAYASDQTPG